MEKLTCGQAKKIDLVDYLALLGHSPQKIRNSDYWYLSPLRNEATASFKVDRKRNLWFDHGLGKGGDLIDFGIQYFNCSVSEFLNRLDNTKHDFSFHQPVSLAPSAGEKKEENKIKVLDTMMLSAPDLVAYLSQRSISLSIAQSVCREVTYELYGRQYTAIGFPNDAGGYELRNADFKGSSSPKAITFFDNDNDGLTVFEGFFDYLSYHALGLNNNNRLSNFLVLNSLSFFEKSRSLMEQHEQVHLFLNRDHAGISYTKRALEWDNNRYKNNSILYNGHKDLNDFLISKQQQQCRRQSRRKGFRL